MKILILRGDFQFVVEIKSSHSFALIIYYALTLDMISNLKNLFGYVIGSESSGKITAG